MNKTWDERYSAVNYIYGTDANIFFKQQLQLLKPGKILLPAEGEGRNAIFAAKNQWQVTAFDPSIKAKEKALKLAKNNNVTINYLSLGYQDMNFEAESFDAIGLIFTHMPATLRPIIHKKLVHYLKPKGVIILQGFEKEQLRYVSGGPKDKSMLFSEEELKEDFKNLNDIKCSTTIDILNEGDYHKGESSIISFIGTKL